MLFLGLHCKVFNRLSSRTMDRLGEHQEPHFFYPEPPEPTLIASYSYLDLPYTLPPTPQTLPTLHLPCHPFRDINLPPSSPSPVPPRLKVEKTAAEVTHLYATVPLP